MDAATPADILKEFWEERRQFNPNFSMRSLARAAGLSASFLSLFFAGKRSLSEEKALMVASNLKWSKTKAMSFARACFLARSGLASTTRLDLINASGLKKRRSSRAVNLLEVDSFRLISDWYHGAILQLIELKGFQPESSWIANRLGISGKIVEGALRRLLDLQLVKVEHSKLIRVEGDIEIPSVPSKAIQSFHRSMQVKAGEALVSNPPAERDFTGIFVGIDKAMLPEIRQKIRAFQHEILELADRAQDKDALYFLSTALFRIDMPTGGGHEKG